MPPRKSDAKARKSGLSQQESRTARKAANLERGSESGSDEENVQVSSSGSPGRRGTTSDSKDRSSTDVESTLLRKKPLGSASKSTRTSANKPASAASATAVGSKANKAKAARPEPASASKKSKRKYEPTPEESEDEDSGSPEVKSRSGPGSSYVFDVEDLGLTEDQVRHSMSYHKSITTTLEREGKNEKVKFERGQVIFVLPDPATLPARSRDIEIAELDDELFWVAQIEDCCAVEQDTQDTQNQMLGILKVRWFYTGDMALGLNLHRENLSKIRRHNFKPDELILSDHLDFIGIETFAGFADRYHELTITGLEVADTERLKKPSKRAKPTKLIGIEGFNRKQEKTPRRTRKRAE